MVITMKEIEDYLKIDWDKEDSNGLYPKSIQFVSINTEEDTICVTISYGYKYEEPFCNSDIIVIPLSKVHP